MKTSDNCFELSKMAITPIKKEKKKVQLISYCIKFVKKNNFERLILFSNTMLKNVIHIYKKYGFIEVPVEENSPYKRGDIKMELV
tara:strand:+ start:13179 stop:13433 length:255 start_codon:yes stop_codon:yes gene_type:complete